MIGPRPGRGKVINAAPELRAEDVSFAYLGAARAALRHVSLSVAPGELVLVTGASSGIGEALAKAFSREGAKVVLSSRSAAELERVNKGSGSPA